MKKLTTSVLAMLGLCLLPSAEAGTVPLTVKCQLVQKDDQTNTGNKSDFLWVFVLDHSGSMGPNSGRDAKSVKTSRQVTRWEALQDSFEETVRSIPIGSKVQVYCVGGVNRLFWGWDSSKSKCIYPNPKTINTISDREDLIKDIKGWNEPIGGTPLYDALFHACEDVQNFARRTEGNCCVVVFSDGRDEAHADDCKTLNDIRRTFAHGSTNSVGLFAADEFDACLTWIGESSEEPVPPFGEKFLWHKTHEIPFICLVNPATRFFNKPNPLETGGKAEISDLTYLFPMSDERWQAMLKRGTVRPTLELATLDGAVLGSCAMELGKKSNAVFQIPDSVFAGNQATTLKLNLLLPPKDGLCRFSEKTVPVHVMFDKVGKVSITAMRPSGDIYVTPGTKVDFSAEATTGSTFTWNFGDGTSTNGSSVSHVYTKINEAGYPYSLTVSHGKMSSPDPRGGKIYVVDAGIAFSVLPQNATEGVECALTCKAWKDVSSVTWYIDGVCYSGNEQKAGRDTVSVLRHTFDAAREYKVQARANIQRIGVCSTEIATLKVAAKPYARIVVPDTANMKFDADEDVDFAARISGVTSGKWLFRDKAGQVIREFVATVSADKPVSSAKQSFAEGGEYVATFVGKTAAGVDVPSAAMPFRVNPRVVRIEIEHPRTDEEITTDVPDELSAKNVKGVAGKIQWYLTDANHENEKILGESEVNSDGTSAKAVNFKSAVYGEGSFFLVARSADGKASSKPVPFTLRSQARIDIDKPANGQTVPFDGRLTFSAKIASEGGILKSDSVRWIVQRVGGPPEEAGSKESCSYQFKRIPKASSVSYTVRAEATLPSGRIVPSEDERTVIAFCPAIQASIVLPQDGNGVVIASVGRQTDYAVSLKTAEGDAVSDVVWDMGDGVAYTNLTAVKHAYREYGRYQIKASGRCAKCGDAFAVNAPSQLVIEVQPPRASFTIAPDKATFSIRSRVTLQDNSTGDIDRCIWTTNGVEFARCGHGESVGLSLPGHSCEMAIGMRAENDLGASSEAQPRTIRVRYGWLLVLGFVTMAVLLFAPFWKLLTGNGPAGWKVTTYDGPISLTSANFDEVERQTMRELVSYGGTIIRPYWRRLDKDATIPTRDLDIDMEGLGGKDDEAIGVTSDPPDVTGPDSLIPDGGDIQGFLDKPSLLYYRFWPTKDFLKRLEAQGQPARCLRVVLDIGHASIRDSVLLMVFGVLLLCAIAWASLQYAI